MTVSPMAEEAAGRARRMLPGEAVPVGDGVVLKTDVHLPAIPGRHPTILIRTPYGRRRPFLLALARRLTNAGFAVAVQDMRASRDTSGWLLTTGRSEGSCTLTWLARQPWADGSVGMVGLCISSYFDFILASEPPPEGIELRAFVNLIGAVDVHASIYQQGALRLHWGLPWAAMLDFQWKGAPGAWQHLPWERLFRHLPVAEAADGIENGIADGIWGQLMRHPAYGEAWQPLDASLGFGRVAIPVLHVSGWYDIILEHVLTAYGRLASPGGSGAEQRLIVGPWDHQSVFMSLLGCGEDEHRGIDIVRMACRWLERWFDVPARADAEAEFADEPPVTLFVMGEERWLGAREFPPAGVQAVDWYLTSGGGANGAAGDGHLVQSVPCAAGEDRFVYDPDDPVPTAGGVLWPFEQMGLVPGPADQRAIEERADVLVYSSGPLTEDLLLAGPVEVELWAATSARDTDFCAKLVDVAPDGTARVIQDGIVRGRFRESRTGESLLEPGRPYRFRISLSATAHCFCAGHCIRLDVSSSNFPKFDRNLNTGAPLHVCRDRVVAHQRLLHGGETPSRLRLAVLPGSAAAGLEWTPPSHWQATRTGEALSPDRSA
ncbi:MAG TPA: CocE/NonD family hydrolase [Longimicrobiaceae bacterium]|nr:CocE/NonD family hydrolase [Longimicrobiaceae bacterium]